MPDAEHEAVNQTDKISILGGSVEHFWILKELSFELNYNFNICYNYNIWSCYVIKSPPSFLKVIAVGF